MKKAKSINVAPPQYPQKPHSITFHSHTRVDPYYWLREKSNPQVKTLLQAENKYFKSFDAARSLRKSIYSEMKSRWKETDVSLPSKHRSFWYFSRTVEGLDHAIFTRASPSTSIPASNDSTAKQQQEEEQDVLHFVASRLSQDPTTVPIVKGELAFIDVNQLRVELGVDYIEVGDYEVSPEGDRVALTVDLSDGREVYTILVLDISHGLASPCEIIENAKKEALKREQACADDNEGKERSKFSRTSTKATKPRGLASKSSVCTTSLPYHKVLQRIEVYDNAAEIMWPTRDSLLYCCMDDTQRPFGIVLHRLRSAGDVGKGGVEDDDDELVFDEEDVAFWVGSLCHSDDFKFVTFCSASKTSEEWHFAPVAQIKQHVAHRERNLDPRTPLGSIFKVFFPRTNDFEYDISHHDSLFGEAVDDEGSCGEDEPSGAWIVVNNGHQKENFGIDYVLDKCDTANIANWHPLIAYDPAVKIEGIMCAKHFIVVSCRVGGLPTAYLASVSSIRQAHADQRLPLRLNELQHISSELLLADERTTTGRVGDCVDVSGSTDDFDARTFRATITNLVVPAVTFEVPFDIVTQRIGKPFLLRREHVPHGEGVAPYCPEAYTVVQLFAPITSSTPLTPQHCPKTVPVIACYKTSLFNRGLNPMLLSVYGSYGDCSDPEFTAERLSLLDRGLVYAVAAVRGGGELGRVWRNSGRMLNRRNSITDFVACSEHVIHEGLCHPRGLTSVGGSAGGTVVAGAMNLRPDLYLGVVALVPFVDCLTSMLDPSIPLTAAEWEEWGNPIESEEAYHAILEYSPMDNIPPPSASTIFPNIFVESGYTDPRVAYWEPAAFVARLRAIWAPSAAAGRILVHKCNMGAGHMGSSGRYEQLEELAEEYAFIVAVSHHLLN